MRGAVYPLTDGRDLERQVQRLDGRVVALEKVMQ